ncbi:DUF4365 domain-containing protein [Massilia sp. Leaf139]|uniref:DUF4365 domain-containing protein n=1 Tax=Massilia sp. Leaf139 TaxID=1736272 RepID=UPI0007146D26|nr:DUF4365 domain-containing protein [Massilia sp. Leaf139]KQQ96100.1 hypothetical protein ASF77_21590 [Massilia sp. Leaf139]
MITLPERTAQHRTDTLAMKKVSLELGQDLLLRSIDERDYGVDALVERYNSNGAGQFLVFQVKGTQDAIKVGKKGIHLSGFPRRTALYAEEFVHPFIVAYTSVKDGPRDSSPIYYLWLQRYIEYSLDVDEPGWRTDPHETMTLYIPETHAVSRDLQRICNIAESSMLQKQAHRFIVATARLEALKSADPDPTYMRELRWIMSAIQRSPMITRKFDDPTASIKDILSTVDNARSVASVQQKKKRANSEKLEEANTALCDKVAILRRRMNGMLAEVLVMDTQPSANSW